MIDRHVYGRLLGQTLLRAVPEIILTEGWMATVVCFLSVCFGAKYVQSVEVDNE